MRNDPAWPKEKIVSAMNQTTEKGVKIKEPVPVFVIYYTSWVDNDGELNFRDDVYSHDKELAKKMFINGVTTKTITEPNTRVVKDTNN